MCSLQEHSERSFREELARQAEAGKHPVIVDRLDELDWLNEVMEDKEYDRHERVRIIPATGELLPAEERLQNVLKSIVDRMMEEQAKLFADLQFGGVTNKEAEERRAFISGLDIAWSLAKTESLRTDGEGPTWVSDIYAGTTEDMRNPSP